LLEIALNDSSKGILQKDIAASQALSNKYLDHIIHALKTAGLIVNVKGKKSGYRLARDPEQITVFDVHEAFEPGICLVECLSSNYNCDRGDLCIARGMWKDLNLMIASYLKSITIRDLMNRSVLVDEIRQVV
jgi:Rrf2 family protein